jgi:two-component system C4-dicarboxylate transport sensor histidine kinase DctB
LKQTEVNEARIDALLSISASIAHDLRSPLSTLMLLISNASFPSTEHKQLIQSSLERMNAIIDNLVKKHSEDSRLLVENLNLAKVIHEMILEKKVYAADVVFDTTIAPELLAIGDLQIVQRVISNVFDNSIQALAGRANKRIEISAVRALDRIEILIADNGPGIPMAVLKLIGKSNVSTKGITGNGIGLLHSTRLLAKINGKLQIDPGPNGGTVVRIELPKGNY